MMMSKEELIHDIEEARERLNISIEQKNEDIIYNISVELDKLIEQYIAAGY